MSNIENDDIYKGGHVFYFEPNDTSEIGKDQDGQDVQLMPHLEDLCISMRLTAEMYPRNRRHIPKLDEINRSEIETRSLAWISYVNGRQTDTNVSSQIINAGPKMGDENYLTTYYTEISADKYIENELVEGLGVTSVNIAYESWYTPTITINFVDVHGSSLWGREEAIHDKSGNITSDTLLGVFFQQPYPLFRLQVKGFLGHDVTYQLSVSSFKGRYNAQTGNFEATATFIGYSYSLLTDIPIKLLSYVSEMDYVGKQYWDERVGSDEWQLTNADGTKTQPVKLYKLIQDIRSAIGEIKSEDSEDCDGTPDGGTTSDENSKDPTSEDRVVSLEESHTMEELSNMSTEVGAIETALNSFINQCEKFSKVKYGGNMIIGKKISKDNIYEEQMLLIFANLNNKIATPSSDFVSSYKSLVKSIDAYNKNNPKNNFINGCKKNKDFHNKASNVSNKSYFFIKPIKVYGFMTYKSDRIPIVICDPKGIRHVSFNNGETLYDDTISKLIDLTNKYRDGNVSNGNGFGEYIYLIPLGTMRSQIALIKERISKISANAENRIEEKVSDKSNGNEKVKNNDSDSDDNSETIKKRIVDIVGFEPTIGNFTKVVMCHLETFVAVMMKCGEQIYYDLNDRTPSNFNISIDNTDIPYSLKLGKKTDSSDEDTVIWPWPALYRPKPHENSETKANDEKYETLGWTNDYPPKQNGVGWEEQKVILSAMDAIQQYSQDGENVGSRYSNKYACLPMSGADLLMKSPFYNVAPRCTDVENIAPYLGLRIANIIGVGDNLCNASDAEAIGYMDALNLISSYSNYTKLKDCVNAKGTTQDFATQVIEYLTCNNSTPSTQQSENGNKYNIFEFIRKGEGNEYSSTRHPMFIKDGARYKYSYTYTNSTDGKGFISIVPTHLYAFSGTNSPYINRVFEKEHVNNVLVLKPKINDTDNSSGVSQWITYTCNTNKVIDSIKDSNYLNYTNDQLFTVDKNDGDINSLLEQIDSLSDGKVVLRGYSVKDDNELKSFVKRRFNVAKDKYYGIYCNPKFNYRVLMPMLSKVDENYSKQHLVNTSDNSSNVTYDSTWADAKNSDLYKATSLSVKDDGNTFKGGSTEYQLSDIIVGELPIMTNSATKCSLFGSRLYYQQNDINDNRARKMAKAYLLLSSMMAGVDISQDKFRNGIFKKKNGSIIDLLPPFYIYFIGSLLWRERQYINNKKEPINLNGFSKIPSKSSSFISKGNAIFYLDTAKSVQWYTISDYYMPYDSIDQSVKNKLIRLFEEFSNSSDFKTIIDCCELKYNDGSLIGAEKWNQLKNIWTRGDFIPSSPSQWDYLFRNIYGNYSSIVIPSGCRYVLRLLMNDSCKAMPALKRLYGIEGGYLVGRSTTKRVGEETNKEVTVTSEQMRGYLKGFERRIKDISKTNEKNNKLEKSIEMDDVDRNIAVSYYYSLKHLWDTWLISAARDQFTIKNFFNKYFIFIDSFYVNMYNTIKLNCETILEAYDTADANILSFITNVASKERCMFFALPTFMDSNIMKGGDTTVGAYRSKGSDEMSFKKENIRNIFTPYPYNEMGIPSLNNVFVFVYTHPYSSNACENTDKKFDSYMITDTEHWPGQLNGDVLNGNNKDIHHGAVIASPNNGKPDDDDELISARFAYYMPCFGVTVNRGNNYIFKSINVNMDSPKITAVAAQTWEDILSKTGKDGSKRIFFYGQDIFNIYSQYAYSCEIEMLGCVQIQPLMYFQLLNIPMWRGTYMIYKVSHTMQPGFMTTKFIGMKMSRYQAPYADGYYVVGKNSTNSKDRKNGYSNDGSNGNNEDIVDFAMAFLKDGRDEGTGRYSQQTRNYTISNGIGDCSGFTQYVFKQVMGIDIGSNTVEQIDNAISNEALIWNSTNKPSKISLSVLSPGDLIFNGTNNSHKYGVKHVQIYIGNGKVISWGNTNGNNNPRILSLSSSPIYLGVARYGGSSVS